MKHGINTAAVVGAGVMGRAIAAHLAGAGIATHLLDIVPPNLKGDDRKKQAARDSFATAGITAALKSKPATFFDPDAARLVTPGNLEDHLPRLKECDVVIEAIVEDLNIKKKLFATIAGYLKEDAILASNTSGLSLKAMDAVLPESLRKRFMVMHFFNPVRYMRLLELVPGPNTDPLIVQRMTSFGEFLGKGIVFGKDTPNFVANRIGIYGLMKTIKAMEAGGYSIEEVDKIVGKPLGRPSSAAFKTCDIVGIDTMGHVSKNCFDALPEDPERDVFTMPQWILDMVKRGQLGRKSGAGFYKKQGNQIRVLDPKTGDYRDMSKVRFDSLGAAKKAKDVKERIKVLVNADDRGGQFAWEVTAHTLCYAAGLVGTIADDIVNVDRALRWGFNWELGPFEVWDAMGVEDSVARMQKESIKVPKWVLDMLSNGQKSFYDEAGNFYDVPTQKQARVPEHPKQIILERCRGNRTNTQGVVKENLGASLVDIGDGCLCLQVHTKLNTIDGDVIEMLGEAAVEAEKNFEALVIGNDGAHFGAGANIMIVYMAAQQKEWGQIEKVIRDLQAALQGLRYAKVPVVAAPFQYTFGGCAEIAMAADVCQAHAETYMGLVEVGVGLVPAGGGCLRMVERYTQELSRIKGADLLPAIGTASLNISMAKVGTGAEDTRRLRYLLPTDGISLNRDHLLFEAKARALGMAHAGYRPPRPRVLKAAGSDAAATIGAQVWSMVEGGWASEHDALIATKIAHILCGGDVAAGTERSEDDYLALELEAFISLCGEEKTQERIQHMLMKNKPLRN